MILLVVDTSGKNGCLGLARADSGNDSVGLMEEVPLVGGSFSAQLVPQISSLLAKQQLDKSSLDAFVVVSGPGSFTGLRVGLAAIKALAEILHKPIVPVSLLEVVAVASSDPSSLQGSVLAALDAGRGEVYVGEYDVADGSARRVQEQLLTKDEFVSVAVGRVVFTPDETLAGNLRGLGISVSTGSLIRAEMIAKVGYRKLRAGESVSPEQLEANYIRRTDAEILAKAGS
jgi:tRNA threonylcarbamoyladenosine biosynthesis protein TsaB